MNKSAIKKYNWIAFLIVPGVTVLISILLCLLVWGILSIPHIDYDDVTPQTQSAELWKVLEVVEGEYTYVIYSVDDVYEYEDANLIAFQGPDIETINEEVAQCYMGNLATSYWEGEGTRFDFTVTYDFKEYLRDVENNTYYDVKPDSEVITADFSEVTLYDLSDYVGYERHNKSGAGLAVIIGIIYIVGITAIVLAVEFLVAFILKLTVFRVKKESGR